MLEDFWSRVNSWLCFFLCGPSYWFPLPEVLRLSEASSAEEEGSSSPCGSEGPCVLTLSFVERSDFSSFFLGLMKFLHLHVQLLSGELIDHCLEVISHHHFSTCHLFAADKSWVPHLSDSDKFSSSEARVLCLYLIWVLRSWGPGESRTGRLIFLMFSAPPCFLLLQDRLFESSSSSWRGSLVK